MKCLVKATTNLDSTLYLIAWILNFSLKTRIVPDDSKLAKVIPIHKAGDTDNRNNYRPISALPIISKVLGKVVQDSLYKVLNTHNMFSQSSVWCNYSCPR